MPINVLIVDDHRAFRDSFADLLSFTFRGLQIVPAEDATTAQRLLTKISFDLLIVDYQLNAYSGTQLIRQVKQRAEMMGVPSLPIVLMSSNPDMGVFARSLSVPFLHKPPTSESLNEIVGPLLPRRPAGTGSLRAYAIP
jgi:CheY-like chemotaxis protein